ncbi:MAG: hypothetical protein AAGC93_16395 [Cyanobacteria bacterium P01_F01_bin.53]
MKRFHTFGIFACSLIGIGCLGMLANLVVRPIADDPDITPAAVATQAESLADETANAETSLIPEDIPVGSPVAYAADQQAPLCQVGLKQYLSYIEARAAYLLRTHQAQQDADQFLASREQTVIGEMAILSAKTGTFQGNPDHFATLTTLSAERLAVALAQSWHRAERHNHPRSEVKTYDTNLQC